MYNCNRFDDRMNGYDAFNEREGCSMRGYRCAPQGSFRPGMPPHGMPPHGPGFPGFPGMPPHGMGPRRPDRDFLRRRVEEADLGELIDMAGRMLRRRPQGGPAQAPHPGKGGGPPRQSAAHHRRGPRGQP